MRLQPGCMGLQCGVRLVRDVPGSGASSACSSSACSAPSLTPSMSVTSAISPRSRRASSTSPATWGCSLGAWGCSPCARGLQPPQRGATAGRLSPHAAAQLRHAIHTHTRIHIAMHTHPMHRAAPPWCAVWWAPAACGACRRPRALTTPAAQAGARALVCARAKAPRWRRTRTSCRAGSRTGASWRAARLGTHRLVGRVVAQGGSTGWSVG